MLVVNSFIQGDTSVCAKPPVDIDVKVAFYYKDLILKRNFKSVSTGGLKQGDDASPCRIYGLSHENLRKSD